jgi:hypothetical protein
MKRLMVGIAASVGLAGAVLVSPIGGAIAGHTNTVLEASLDGRAEIDSAAGNSSIAGDPNGRGGAYVFGIDGDPKTLCYVLTVDKIAPATAAHIHEGAAGANGPVVVNLARPTDGNSADCLTEGEMLASGPAFPTGKTVAEILANPAAFYVNVHNAEYPGGAIRGQLAAQGH